MRVLNKTREENREYMKELRLRKNPVRAKLIKNTRQCYFCKEQSIAFILSRPICNNCFKYYKQLRKSRLFQNINDKELMKLIKKRTGEVDGV